MSNKSLLVLGSIAYDFIMQFPGNFNDNLSIDTEKNIFNLAVMPKSKKKSFGGTAGNISYNLGILNVPTRVITSVGKDFETLGYKQRIKNMKSVEFWGDEHLDEFTATCYIVNDQNHNQLIIFHEGAMKRCSNIKLAEHGISKDSIQFASVSPDNPGAMVAWAKELIKLEIPFLFDPGQMVHYFKKQDLMEIIPNAYLIIGNEFEMTKIEEILETDLEGLRALNSMIIITLGEKGAVCYWGENEKYIPPMTVEHVADTTGAGDAFRAGLLYGIYHQMSLVKACKFGAIIAGYTIGTVGPQNQSFAIEEIQEKFRLTYRDELF
ncbi:MAG: carbohydrate kinase family protein [Candidatus Lokiarchaeota archaeon]|nr:carbohydrate kinase family protein [Candidatus Harpocratesius repetitus]